MGGNEGTKKRCRDQAIVAAARPRMRSKCLILLTGGGSA